MTWQEVSELRYKLTRAIQSAQYRLETTDTRLFEDDPLRFDEECVREAVGALVALSACCSDIAQTLVFWRQEEIVRPGESGRAAREPAMLDVEAAVAAWKIESDASLPPGTVELRGQGGKVLASIVNIGTPGAVETGQVDTETEAALAEWYKAANESDAPPFKFRLSIDGKDCGEFKHVKTEYVDDPERCEECGLILEPNGHACRFTPPRKKGV